MTKSSPIPGAGSATGQHDRVIVLGAGRSAKGDRPAALITTDPTHRVLDWQLQAFTAVPSHEVVFVGGYRVEEIESNYPSINFRYNPNWENTGPVESLRLGMGGAPSEAFVTYSDVVFRRQLVADMRASTADVVLAIDTRWRTRYEGRSSDYLSQAEKITLLGSHLTDIGQQISTEAADGEFVGLLRLSQDAASRIQHALQQNVFSKQDGLPHVVQFLLRSGMTTDVVDVLGDWAELDAAQDLARFVLGTKAESLDRLRDLVKVGKIGAQVSFTFADWTGSQQECIERIRGELTAKELIVRSSALSEDSWNQSSAGAYTSLLNVLKEDRLAVANAVNQVFASFPDSLPDNQVLVQSMLSGVTSAGVVMTRTPALKAPYYVINYDTSGSTDSVTSGEGADLRTLYLHRDAELGSEFSDDMRNLIPAIQEVESLVGHSSLDIEFATTADGIHILQVRPIAVASHSRTADDARITQGLDDSKRRYHALQGAHPGLAGDSTMFSVMADWNPAEMIGTKPTPLAFSLYRHLITDDVWARQRAEYGYRDVRPHNLIVDYLGHPFVDIRVDFNSFVPAAIDENLASRLVSYYQDRLRGAPELHDKVEFEILFTCRTLDRHAMGESLLQAGFSAEDVAALDSALHAITRRGIERCQADAEEVAGLARRFTAINVAEMPPLERLHAFVEHARRWGVLYFSHMARHAFVAVALLKSIKKIGLLDDADIESFLGSLATVATDMQSDAGQVKLGSITWDDFVLTYGHLRPGSYDITSPNYASDPQAFLRPMVDQAASNGEGDKGLSTVWDDSQQQEITAALRDAGFELDCQQAMTFMRSAIEGREFGKFQYMRFVNGALEAISEFASQHGVGRNDIAYVRLHDILSFRRSTAINVHERLMQLVNCGKEEFLVTEAVQLPDLLLRPTDFDFFEQHIAEPNYISRKKIRAEVVHLLGSSSPRTDLAGKIVAIPNADPGYDWLFSRKIGGLITQYGGVNSHMAIRSAEFQLPAAIGTGATIFAGIERAKIVELDCQSRQIRVLE